METNPSPSPSCNETDPNLDSDLEFPVANGNLRLNGNLGTWIQNNPPSHLLVKHLYLDFSDEEQHVIEDSIDQLTQLTHLAILNANNSLKCFPTSIANLHYLRFLKFDHCSFQELPSNLAFLKTNLTHLTLFGCGNIKSLPETIATLSTLTSLHIQDCNSLTELPSSFGLLGGSLTHLTLCGCDIESLPKSLAILSNLTSLNLNSCESLFETPSCLGQLTSLTHLTLQGCEFELLPYSITTLSNLSSLHLQRCNYLSELPASLIQLRSLKHFSLEYCDELEPLPDSIENLPSLESLSIKGCHSSIKFIPRSLILLDIQDTRIKYIPWSIMKLRKLRFLILPLGFRLETLPFRLNDSILISVQERHIRKTWKQLKQEIGVSDFPVVQGEYPSIIAPPGYLSLHGGLEQWISDNYGSDFRVKMLELDLPSNFDVQGIRDTIQKLPNLTHLFVTNGGKKGCLPRIIKDLQHYCLQLYDFKHRINLCRLSNLNTFDLTAKIFPKDLNLPVSLRCLSLRSPSTFSLPASLATLSNLHTLELSGCYNLASLPLLNIVTLKLNCIGESLPIGLRNLEILLVKSDCFDEYSDMDSDINRLEHCLTKLVNLEMLSLTCYHFKYLPSMAGQHNLRVLLLKDCFALKQLMPGVEQLVELHTLDISGTRIKSLPDSITKLSKLQKLTLPKCFTQKLPRNLEEVSVIDDTDKCYYKNMGYYDSDFETVTDSSYEGTDNGEVVPIEVVDEAIPEDPIQGGVRVQACEQNDVIAQVPRVLKSTMKCRKNENGIICSPSKKMKQGNDSKDGDSNTDSTCLEKPSKPAIGHEQKRSNGAAATIATVEKPRFESVNESRLEVPQHIGVHFDGVNQSDIAQSNGNSSSFDFVKVSYEGNSVWIAFSLTSNFDQLNESICKKFSLEVNKFEIKYLDQDQEWSLMTCVSDLTHAQLHTSSSERKFVRLSITVSGDEYTEVHLDGANQSNIAQRNESSSSFDFVKVCYEGDSAWLDISLTSNMDQLNESIHKKFGLEVNKIKIKYLDEDKEWLLMTHLSDLMHALLHTSLSGRKYVWLSITHTRVIKTERASEKNNEQIIPKKSEDRPTRVFIHSERKKSNYIQCTRENSNQPSDMDCILLPEFCVPCIMPLIEGYNDVKADGNCGFRVIAMFEYDDEEKWLDVRIDLLTELNANKNLYRKALGSNEEFERAKIMVNWLLSPAEKMHWFEATCLGLVVATKYQKVFTCWSTECCTYLPLVSRLVDHKPPTMYINMARINGNHFIALQMPTDIPLPPPSPLWKRHRCDTVKHWSTSIFKKQLDDYLQLHD